MSSSEVWSHQRDHEALMLRRHPFFPVTMEAIVANMNRFCPESGPVLQIGAGNDPTHPFLPQKLRTRIISSDIAFDPLRDSKKRDGSTAVIADLKRLPFGDSQFCYIMGLSTLDVVEDLPRAASEAYRVLVKGAYFQHFLDLVPNLEMLMKSYLSKGLIPFLTPSNGGHHGFALVSHDEWDTRFKANNDHLTALTSQDKFPNLIKLLQDYINDPLTCSSALTGKATINPLDRDTSPTDGIISLFIKVLDILGIKYSKTDTIENLFANKLCTALKEAGFLRITTTYQKQVKRKVNLACINPPPQFGVNMFYNNVGVVESCYDQRIENQTPGQGIIVSRVQIVTAIK